MESLPVVPYWHIWTDTDGISHQSRCELAEFQKASIQPAAAPQWIGAETRSHATVLVTVLPVGWIGDWHENPRPQWIIPLSGRWFVESNDGVRVEMGPGEISFGEDQNTRRVDGKRGHLSGTVGPEPAVLMLVQFEMMPTVASACRFRWPMDGFDTCSPRFARYILSNAALETLATGFRWIEGPVWMGDANCLLFQDLPNDRTMRWIEGQGLSVYRAPSHYANGQTRDRQGRLIACSHRGRCLYRTEYDGHVTTLVDRHADKRLNSPNDIVVKSDGSI